MKITVLVSAGAKKNEIVSLDEKILKIKIHAQREKQKANEELLEFLSEKLDISKTKIHILLGKTSKKKLVEIEIEEEAFFKKIQALI